MGVLQHVAYEGADSSMRSLVQAFNLFAMGGMPNAISAAMSQATASLVPNDLNEGNLPAVYFINVAFGFLGCGAYYLVSSAVPGGEKNSNTELADCAKPVAQQTAGPVLHGRLTNAGSRESALQEKQEQPVAGTGPAS